MIEINSLKAEKKKYCFKENVSESMGVKPALLYEYIEFLCSVNKNNGTNLIDGKYFCRMSVKNISEHFPMFSPRQIKYCLKKLESKGYIESGCYNEKKYDKTKWYTITGKVSQESKLRYVDTDVATKVGVDAASLFCNIEYWCEKNKKDGINFRYGRNWVRSSTKTMAKHTPGFSEGKVKYLTKILANNKLIAKRNNNPNKFNRTLSYSLGWSNLLEAKETDNTTKGTDIPENITSKKNVPTLSNFVQAIIVNRKIDKRKRTICGFAYSKEFEEIWETYPRKEGKKEAYFSFLKAIKEGISCDKIRKGIKNYTEYVTVKRFEKKYIKYGSTYFGLRCWNKEYKIPKTSRYCPKEHSYDLAEYARGNMFDYDDSESNCENPSETAQICTESTGVVSLYSEALKTQPEANKSDLEDISFNSENCTENDEVVSLYPETQETQPETTTHKFKGFNFIGLRFPPDDTEKPKPAPMSEEEFKARKKVMWYIFKNEAQLKKEGMKSFDEYVDMCLKGELILDDEGNIQKDHKKLQKYAIIRNKSIEKNKREYHNSNYIQSIYIYIYRILYSLNKERRDLLRLKALNTRISRLMIELLNIQLKKKDIENTVVRGKRISDLPRDTSKLSDEIFVRYVEKISKLEEEESRLNGELENLKFAREMLINTISTMPDCELKEIAEMYFISESKISNICEMLNKSKQHIYSVISDIRKQLKGGELDK